MRRKHTYENLIGGLYQADLLAQFDDNLPVLATEIAPVLSSERRTQNRAISHQEQIFARVALGPMTNQ